MEWSNELVEQLLQTKEFGELDVEERNVVLREIGSEEQYNLLRKVSLTLVSNKADLSPDPRILEKLRTKMSVPWWESALTVRVPAYAAVIVTLIISLVIWTVRTPEKSDMVIPIVQVKMDTFFLAQKPDTILVEKIVYRNIKEPSHKADGYSIVNTGSLEGDKNGVNMKEKEELENLLVNGS